MKIQPLVGPKRTTPVPVALSDTDRDMLDGLSTRIPFRPSRSAMGCMMIRDAIDRIRRGDTSLELLFDKYLLHPISENVPPLAEYSEDVEQMIVAFMADRDLPRRVALELALRFGLVRLEAMGWQDPHEGEERQERMRA